MSKGKTKRKNKSSIVRIIISNFDDKEIKELKVLYTKQGGVDTFEVETSVLDNKIIFNSVEGKCREITDELIAEVNKEDNSKITVVKKSNNKEIRNYEIKIRLLPENSKIIQATVIDLKEENKNLEKRYLTSTTERKLLKFDVMEKYSQIAECNVNDINSQKIYKINKFLSYRSNMLIYFQFVNDFLVKNLEFKENEEVKEIWKLVKDNKIKDESYIDKIAERISEYISEEIRNHNNKIEKLKEKEHNKNLEKFEKITIEKLKEDIEKIIYIFAEFRHKLMHYNYDYFEKLFDNRENSKLKIKNKEIELNKILDLNMFKELGKLKNLKEENKTNYLSDDSKIRVLGRNKKAKNIYNLYNKICNRKNGFNNFINSLFLNDGLEDKEFKEIIRNNFEKRIEFLEKFIKENPKSNNLEEMTEELENKKNIKKLIGEPYIWDIHQSRKYKDLYNKRKNIVAKNSKLILSGINKANKNAITKNNKELLKIKIDMEKITKLNSLIRLEYKMQVAFGFLYCNFPNIFPKKVKNNETNKFEYKNHRRINIDDFLDRFYSSKLEEIQNYMTNKEKYLSAPYNDYFDDKLPVDLNTGSLEEKIKDINFICSNGKENNLSKFYVLMYLLIPIEMRGDFLGFAKKHYYDIKNIDFVEIKEEKNNEEILKDKFFHNLRLFEKNSKDFEIIKYELIEFNNLKDDFEEIYQKLNLDTNKIDVIQYSKLKPKHLFDKNIILPLMKYYEIIFKLLNDIEIHILFKIKKEKNINSLSETIEKVTMDKYLNFSDLFLVDKFGLDIKNDKEFRDSYNQIENENLSKKLAKNKKSEYKKQFDLRNSLAHLNYQELFIDVLINNRNINLELDKILKNLDKYKLSEIDLATDFINDFYMKKEQFLFNLNQTALKDISSPDKKKRLEKEKELLKFYTKSDNPDLPKILNKYKEILKNIENKSFDKRFFDSISDLEIIINKKDKKRINEMSVFEKEDYVDKIKGKLKKDASDLLGIYKKYIILTVKQKLIKLFIQGEKRFINIIPNKNFDNDKKSITFVIEEQSKKKWYENGFKAEYNLLKNKANLNLMKEFNIDITLKEEENKLKFILNNPNAVKKQLHKRNITEHYIHKIKTSYIK